MPAGAEGEEGEEGRAYRERERRLGQHWRAEGRRRCAAIFPVGERLKHVCGAGCSGEADHPRWTQSGTHSELGEEYDTLREIGRLFHRLSSPADRSLRVSSSSDRARISHLLIRVTETRSEAQAYELIHTVHQQCLEGADFAELATRHSEDSYAPDGGLMGWVGEGELLPILAGLQDKEFVAASDVSGMYVITREGRQLLGDMIVETESYIDRYDVFKDVAYDSDGQAVEFGTGRGDDLRVQVYDSEGLDPIRTVFLLRMYDGTLDAYAEVWRERIHEDGFFTEILLPVLDYDRADDALDLIMDSGFAYMEEQSEKAREDTSQQEVLRRMREE